MAWGFVDGGSGLLNPRTYEYEPGSSTAITWLVVFTDGDDFLRLSARNPDGLNGLWLKLGDDLAVEMDAATRTSPTGIVREWDIPEGSLDWSDRADVEVSLWEQQPPGIPTPARQLWSATLGAGTDGYGGNLGRGVGFGKDIAGTLDPGGYEYEPGSTAEFDRLLLLTDDDDRLYVAVYNEAASAMEGLWLKVSDDLAVQLGQPDSVGASTTRWFFNLVDGTLDWSDGNDYAVSLWDKQPPGTLTPARELWTATMTAGLYLGGSLGTYQGYGRLEAGSLSPDGYEYAAGSTATFDRIQVRKDGTDRLYVSTVTAAGASGLQGLWLQVGDDLAVELGAASGADNDWIFDITEDSIDWATLEEVEVSLWNENPIPG